MGSGLRPRYQRLAKAARVRPRPPEEAWQAAPPISEPSPIVTAEAPRPSFHLTSAERLGLVYSSLGFFVVLAAIALGATIAFSAGSGAWLLITVGAALLLLAVNRILNLDLVVQR
jgi:hypothetical protein